MEIKTATDEDREKERRARLAEKGKEPPCPLCGKPRVRRSDYIRCNPCGMNWSAGEDITKDARISRGLMRSTTPTAQETEDGAPTVENTSEKEG